jgi:cysteine-rich repeat protein
MGGTGADELNGGDDTDTAVFVGLAAEWSIVILGPGEFAVTNLADPTDVDHLEEVEFAEFTDTTIDLSTLSDCGNGFVEGPEQCDDGNTADGDCCSSSCQFEPNTTVCRASAGVCDIAETCTGSSATCPSETFQSPSTVCREATGECDLAEHCSGASAECPSDSIKANGTTCTDDGNVCSTDICNGSSTECQHPAGNAGAVCRASTGACDTAETCTGASTSCPADTGAPDSDGDGQCDAVDLCTNGVAITGAKLKLSNFVTGPEDDKVNFSGTLTFATPPTLDPITNGARVVVTDADGPLIDAIVPAGAYNSATKTGWKVNKSGTTWTFSSPTVVDDAINKVVLKPKGSQITFIITGKKGAFAIPPLTLPLQATLVLDPPLAMNGECGEANLTAAHCAFNAAQTTLICK